MIEPTIAPHADSDPRGEEEQRNTSTPPVAAGKKKKRANMHEGTAIWCDCCSCEAEPRWIAVAEELGIDLSDYEDEDSGSPRKS